MGRPLYTNNAASALAFGINNTQTTIQLQDGMGSLFPSPSGGDYFYITVTSISVGSSYEIMQCTARSGDILTVARGAEGTNPQYFNLGDNVQLRITAAGMNFLTGNVVTSTQVQEFTATQGQTVFTLTNFDYAPSTNNLSVFVNGSKQVSGVNFTETNVNTITFSTGLNVGDSVEAIVGLVASGGIINAGSISYTSGANSLIPADGTVATALNDLSDKANGTNYIGYNQSGTGASNRVLTSKLQESVSVKDFGAVGDGTTDDTAAIQNAIDAVNSAGGGTLLFGSGLTYLVTTLTPKASVYIDLNNSTLYEKNSSSNPIFYDGRTTGSFLIGFGVSNGTLNLNGLNNKSSNSSGSGIWLTNWKQLVFENLTVINANRVVFNFYGCGNVIFNNIYCTDCGISTSSYQAYIGYFARSADGNNCQFIDINNFVVSNCYGFGFHFYQAINFTANNVLFNSLTYPTSIAITCTQASYGVLNNVTCNNVGNSGTGDSIEINASTDIQFNNTVINSPGRYALLTGDNGTGSYNQRISFKNFVSTSTGGSYSLALAYVQYCTFDGFNCDKGLSDNNSITGDCENTISNSTFNIAVTGFFTYYNKFSLSRVNFTNIYINNWNGNVGVFSNPKSGLEQYSFSMAIGATSSINISTLINFGLKGFAAGKLKINSSYNGSQASYQECAFLGSSNLTDFNLSSITTVSTSIPRAVTISTVPASGTILLTNSTGTAINVNWTIELSGASS